MRTWKCICIDVWSHVRSRMHSYHAFYYPIFMYPASRLNTLYTPTFPIDFFLKLYMYQPHKHICYSMTLSHSNYLSWPNFMLRHVRNENTAGSCQWGRLFLRHIHCQLVDSSVAFTCTNKIDRRQDRWSAHADWSLLHSEFKSSHARQSMQI